MKNKLALGLCAVAFSIASGTTLAQDYEYHPMLEDNFDVFLGYFRSDNTFKISAENINFETGQNDDTDFGKNLGVDQTSALLNGQLRWRFGSKRMWSIAAQYFENNASGDATLKEDVEWQDVIFREGTFVGAGVSLSVTRLFLGRSFIKNERSDFGAGVGIHNLDLSAYIEGEILVNDGGTGFHRGNAAESQILPNIGAWYLFSPARKWLLRARVDWISANIDDYDGTLWNTNVGVNYQFARHFGVDLSYQYFNLNLTVDGSNWKGGVDMTYSGPVLALTANW